MKSPKTTIAVWLIALASMIESLSNFVRAKALELRREGIDEEERALPWKEKDAYYSEQAARHRMDESYYYYGDFPQGPTVYERVNGDRVYITEVVEVGKKPGSRWPDLKYVGRVARYVGQAA
jgi:hypothetical protein